MLGLMGENYLCVCVCAAGKGSDVQSYYELPQAKHLCNLIKSVIVLIKDDTVTDLTEV